MSGSEDVKQNEQPQNEADIDAKLKVRPRSATLLTLKWLAERFRKSTKIKTALAEGSYSVDTDKLAKALLNKEH
jgi:anti-sigma28 factor (negative regulator of flagellin synthesis)